ncbi:Uu.00g105990.m01.CDS01 [Anthostomella pinea]|uniref:cellulase n=1 Tax=Anthostomella pinea TaxID=933095 RepID=A0AAI8VE47_9PEZI|nr:Uu.00g105990.m01.CDS01 [Anthostomella pinea]
MFFSPLLVVAVALSGALAAPTPNADPAPNERGVSVNKKRSNFWFAGVNESGAEFGTGSIPGTKGTDYTWPLTSSVDTLMGKGFNIFRIPFLMERMVPGSLTSGVNAAYLADMQTLVSHITSKGGYAAICAQNFGRYYGNVITDTSGFQSFWQTVATQFKSNGNVIFDTNNEYHDMDNTLVGNLNQAAINGIRAAGATSQTIFVEGNSYTGAWTWVSSGTSTAMAALTDPNDNVIYEMHQYLDSDGSGTSSTCVSSTIGSQRLAAATAWLQSNGKNGILGETAAGSNSVCISALQDMLSYMKTNNSVWRGWLLWGGGPWWGDYMFSMEPSSGTQYVGVMPSVLQYI